MLLAFERGDPKRPRGHAVVYFRATTDPNMILASYVVVPPISMDFSKFIPPMFAAQLPGILPSGPQVFPLPPVPEKVESMAFVEALAASREDDLIHCGSVDPMDIQRMLSLMTEVASEYGQLYEGRPPLDDAAPGSSPTGSSEDLPAAGSVDVDELFMSLMSDTEKVNRIAKMLGTVRYAVEGRDTALLEETVTEMERIGRHLANRYRVSDLIEAARDPDPKSGKLAELLLQRCYKLAVEEYDALKALDAEIEALKKKES
ncbi:MAG: hypothetical protein IT306_28235 [Chloroflexi bacterium]|nr:hypothetical protein [Chloroflexota bacterium]